uniref:Transcription termination factor MTERF6, chloroplastic/mitochondrial n=1 Tax=Ananas comosus var. bracteatus TaxID=296719 RepID=A0A6V7QSH0_ANACO
MCTKGGLGQFSPSHAANKLALVGTMGSSGEQMPSILGFLKDKGFDDKSIQSMLGRCKRLHSVEGDKASENWNYLRSIGIQERKLPHVVSKCPKVLALGLNEKLIPTVECLSTLGTKPGEVASAITKFPHILAHSVEEKLCPFWLFSRHSGSPKSSWVSLNKEGVVGKILTKDPFIMGYSVEKRLLPTTEFLKSIGLSELDLRRVVINFPEVLCRDVEKILKPNLAFLRRCGFNNAQVKDLVAGYPPILIKSVKNSLEPRIKFLVEEMGRGIGEAAEYPEFFRHGLKKSLEYRQRLVKKNNLHCSLSEMLNCNQKKFVTKFGLMVGHS